MPGGVKTAGAPGQGSSARATWERVLIGLTVLFYLFLFPHGIHGDGAARWEGLQHLFQGRIDAIFYSLVGPLFSAPLIPLGLVWKDAFWWVSRYNTFLILLLALYLYRRFSRAWDAASARTLVLLVLCATMFPKHATDYYAEVFSTVLVVIAIFEFRAGRGVLAVALTVLSVWNTPGTAAAGAAQLSWFSVRSRRWRYATAIPLLAAGIVGENLLKFGEPFPNAYLSAAGFKNYLPYSAGPGFNYPLLFGLLSVLLSFGKGLVFFMPGILGLFRRDVWEDRDPAGEFLKAGAAYFAGLLVVYARFWSWSGDWFWGPRFYLFVSVFAAVLLAKLLREGKMSLPWRVYWLVAAALSFWVGCQGILYGQDFLEDCYATHGPEVSFICWYVPEYSVLWRVFVVWPVPHGRKVAYLVLFLLVAGTVLWTPGRELARSLRDEAMRRWRAYRAGPAWRY